MDSHLAVNAAAFPVLSEGNWPKWSRHVSAKIMSAGAQSILDGTWQEPSPPSGTVTATQQSDYGKEKREYDKAFGAALGAILGSIDEANYRRAEAVSPSTPKGVWDVLKAHHNQKNSPRQFLLFQELGIVHQAAGETLTAYHQRVEAAGDKLNASITTGTAAKDIIDLLIAFISISNVIEDDSNDSLIQNITIAGNISRAAITDAFTAEQTRRDTSDRMKESGLATRGIAPSKKRGGKIGRASCRERV